MRLQPGGPSGVPSIQNSFPTTVLHQTTHLALILQDWLRTLLPPFPTLGKVRLPPVFLPHPTLPSTAALIVGIGSVCPSVCLNHLAASLVRKGSHHLFVPAHGWIHRAGSFNGLKMHVPWVLFLFLFFFKKKSLCIYSPGCAGSELQHVGSSSLTRDQGASCIGSSDSLLLDHQGSPSLYFLMLAL